MWRDAACFLFAQRTRRLAQRRKVLFNPAATRTHEQVRAQFEPPPMGQGPVHVLRNQPVGLFARDF